jgi:homoserine kinase
VRVPASSANLGPGFDVLALALDLQLEVEASEASNISIEWTGEGAGEVPLNRRNLLVRSAQEPFAGWSRPLDGLELHVRNQIPIGRGLGSSAAAIVAGIMLGAKLRALPMSAQRILELAFPLEGHGDNLAAALYGGFCIAVTEDGGVRVHRLDWPSRWRAVLFVPKDVSPTHEARRLVPRRPAREDAVFNLGRVAEWVLACTTKDRSLVASAMQDRLHQPGRARAYVYLDDVIAAASQAGALGAALSGAGGSVIAIADRNLVEVGHAMTRAAGSHGIKGNLATLRADAAGAG